MRRIIVLLTMAAVMVAMIATPGTPASAQSPCPPTGPSGGPATILLADEAVGAGFVCVDEQAQEFFCPPEYELQLFPVLPGEVPGPGFIAECAEQSSSNDGGGTGGSDGGVDAEVTQNGDQTSETGEYNLTVNVS
jgi:hypothetical protein